MRKLELGQPTLDALDVIERTCCIVIGGDGAAAILRHSRVKYLPFSVHSEP